jgi:serine/threonine protein kinase
MNQDLWKEIEELYRAVVDCEPTQRDALLAGSSPEARETVLKMLTPPSGDNILERPIWITEGEASAPVRLEKGASLGPYEIEDLLGEGGMGAVYRALDSRLNRKVAIKILPPALSEDPVRLRRFEQEARAAGTLTHPNILTVFDVGTHDGILYLVTELLQGRTLRDELRGGKLARGKALNYARMIAAGLIAAHEAGITHRDLKPENLFVTRDGRVKILDFGLAKFAAPLGGSSVLAEPGLPEMQSAVSHPGIVVGTVGYMSPEQAQGTHVDHRSDLFNLGIVLYEMITGRRPFHGETPIETLHAILKQDPALEDPGIDQTLARFLRHCLEKDPANRFQSAKDLAFDLDGLEPLSIDPPKRRYAWALALMATVVTLGILLIAYRIIPNSEPQQSFQQITYREGNITNARFTPDGKTILYTAAWDGGPRETYRTTASGPEAQSIGISKAGIASISSSGEVALIMDCETNWGECQGTLASVPLDGGSPRDHLFNVQSADWDPREELAAVRYDGTSIWIEYLGEKLYKTESTWISHLRFSPKGDVLAFFEHPEFTNNDGSVEVIDLAQRTKRTLVKGQHDLKGLAWTPSGDEIWYSGSDARTPELRAVTPTGRTRLVWRAPGWPEIVDIARDGRVLLLRQIPRTRIVFSPEPQQPTRNLSWLDWSTTVDLSADGTMLLFYEWGEAVDGVPFIYLRDTAAGEGNRLSEGKKLGEGKPLALAPKKDWVLAWKRAPTPQLILVPTGAGETKVLPTSGIKECYSGAWFPDEKKVLATCETTEGAFYSYVQPIDGGPAKIVASKDVRAVLISPEGSRLAAYGPEPGLIPANGGALQPIRGLKAGDELVQWSDDGGSLYVRDDDQSKVNLFRVDLASGRRVLKQTLAIPDSTGLVNIQPDSTKMTPDGRAAVFTFFHATGELYVAEGLH